jgi:hypothetical protein
MSRNRKSQTAVRLVPALRVLSLCLFLGGSAVGYVWQKEQINTLMERLKQREKVYDELRRKNDGYSRLLSRMQSPGELELRIKQSDLGLVAPQPDQIVRIVEVPVLPDVSTSSEERLFAAQHSRPLLPPVNVTSTVKPVPNGR